MPESQRLATQGFSSEWSVHPKFPNELFRLDDVTSVSPACVLAQLIKWLGFKIRWTDPAGFDFFTGRESFIEIVGAGR